MAATKFIEKLRLFSFFGENDKKNNRDSQQGAENVEISQSTHKFAGLSSLFIHNSQKKDDNDRQSSENVDRSHSVHIFFFISLASSRR